VELLFPHENCIARLLAQIEKETKKISCFAMLARWDGKHATEERRWKKEEHVRNAALGVETCIWKAL
jgi:hypothetical protein